MSCPSMLGLFQKNPADQADYDIDFARWLPEGDTILTAEAVASPTGDLTIKSVLVTAQVVKVWLNGGLDGERYTVNVTARTNGGRIKEVCFQIRVRDC